MTADLDAERIRNQVSGDWGRSLSILSSTDSTMNDASEAASKGAPDGHVVVADQQRAGRGAHGRQWSSPGGSDLYLSIVARPRLEAPSTPLVTLAAGLGVRQMVAERLPGRRVQVKWPNDVWIDRRKCAGILVETRMTGVDVDAAVIGIGLNVNRLEWPGELRDLATSLRAERENQEPLDRSEVLCSLLGHVERWVKRLERDGAAVVVDALRPHLALVGEQVRWDGGHGVFDGIDPRGAARVRTDAGIEVLHAARFEPLSA